MSSFHSVKPGLFRYDASLMPYVNVKLLDFVDLNMLVVNKQTCFLIIEVDCLQTTCTCMFDKNIQVLKF